MKGYTDVEILKQCNACPRNCKVNRFQSASGFCKTDSSLNIASICLHRGEEPVISGNTGICNVFFAHCNLQCIYCQNYQISCNEHQFRHAVRDVTETVQKIGTLLNICRSVGFVTPSHCIPQMKLIITSLHKKGHHPVIVMNTNAFDKVDVLRELEDLVDVYLPDLKYLDPTLSTHYSGAADYPEVAKAAIKEMYRQKGSTLITGDDNIAESGLIIRHLVLPNHVEQSIQVLRFIAEELSASVYLSLMAQYYPTNKVKIHPQLNRPLCEEEYSKVLEEAQKLGFYRLFVQEMDSKDYYQPDFERAHPFERK